ncbi:MAG TPA: formylglycine-generating enzyme family protein, partial [Anaerolineaceae bacterium]|nr:formylglycine-generating enzyme family protein [Anaerolineaceae bacterium]
PAPVWTLDDGLYALAGMETAQEWPRAEALLKQLEAAYPGNPRLILARKRIEQALAARRAAEERAAREAAERARQAETARQKAETARQKAETETRLKQAAADHARPQAGETSPPADRSQRTSGQLVSRRTLLIGAIAVGLLVFLMVCGLGAAWMLDALPGNQPTAVSNITPPPPCTNIGQTWTSPVDGMNLVCVPAGDFLMGAADGDADADDDEKPQHTVYLDAYWIDQTEVTNAMFSEFVAATRYRTTAEMEGSGWAYMGSGWDWVDGANWKHPSGPDSKLTDKDHHPVVQISWADAVAYCEWVGRRLPSEAQWEKAARGSGGQTYPWGDQLPGSKTLNFNFGDGDTTAVGSYPDGVSPSGALDMAGNVWEWTADWYDRGYYSSQTTWRNPVGPTRGQYRVVRGGSWCSNSLGDVSSSGRDWNAADDRSDHLGFRCLIDAAP